MKLFALRYTTIYSPFFYLTIQFNRFLSFNKLLYIIIVISKLIIFKKFAYLLDCGTVVNNDALYNCFRALETDT